MNIQVFSAEHQPAAQKEIDRLMDCSMMLEIHIQKGNLPQALALTKDMHNSITSLQKMIKEKELNDQLNSIVAKLISIGGCSSVINRYFDNKKG